MSALFRKGKSRATQYHQLDQSDSDLSDTDEDEKVVFRKPGDLELNLYPDYKFKAARRNAIARARCKKIAGIGFLVVLIIFVVVALAARYKIDRDDQNELQCSTCDWKITLKDQLVENGLVLLDVDGDNKDDLIFSVADSEVMYSILQLQNFSNTAYSSLHDFCKTLGKQYPCSGFVYAVRGYDGKVLWKLPVRGILFSMNCDEIDIDGDGRKDCIGTGRIGSVTAFNPYKGAILWTTENDVYFKSSWNTLQARALPDWDKDGIPEILIANGGNPKKAAEDVNRESGRLVILSGATGKPMGNKYLEMPESKETYMTPVLYQQTNSAPIYVLFGNGGETVPGNFMGISLTDLCHYILGENYTACPARQELAWSQLVKDEDGIFIIVRGDRKGSMVPPVIVDINKDGVMDIVVSMYNGAVILLDGKTMEPNWTSSFTNKESYSTPVPGHFNDDDTLDFLVYWNVGTWEDTYNSSVVAILDGKDGKVLWSATSTKDIQASGLVIQTNQTNRDMFLFRHRHLYQAHSLRAKRHGGGEVHGQGQLSEQDLTLYPKEYFTQCSAKNDPLEEEVLLLDRTLTQNPLKVLELRPEEYYYEPLSPFETSYHAIEHPDNHNGGDHGHSNAGSLEDANGGHVDDSNDNHHENVNNLDKQASISSENGLHDEDQMKTNTSMLNEAPKAVNGTIGSLANNGSDAQSGNTDLQSGRPRKKRDQKKRSEPAKWCSYQVSSGTTTGAIGDVDGDGLLDYISIVPYHAKLFNTEYQNLALASQTILHKVSLEKHLTAGKLPSVPLDVTTSLSSSETSKSSGQPKLLAAKQQKWTKYMGSQGNNWFQ